MLLCVANNSDTMEEIYIELISMLAKDLGITYGAMCIDCTSASDSSEWQRHKPKGIRRASCP